MVRQRTRARSLVPGTPTAIAASAVWATNALAARTALAHCSLELVLLAMTSGAVVTLAILRVVSRRRAAADTGSAAPSARAATAESGATAPRPSAEQPESRRASVAKAVALGSVGVGGTLVLQYVGFAHAPLLAANVVSYGWPMFSALALAAIIRDRAALLTVPCSLTGFAGVVVMLGGASAIHGGSVIGYGAALLSAVCMATYTLGAARLRPPQIETLLAGALTGVALAAGGIAAGGRVGPITPWVLFAVYGGVGPVATGYALWTRAMATSAGRLAPLGDLIPLLSTGLLIATGSPASTHTLIGAAIVLTACTAILAVQRAAPRLDEIAPGTRRSRNSRPLPSSGAGG